MGGGALYLDFYDRPEYREKFEKSISFFQRQPCIHQCKLYEGEKYDYRLDEFRGHALAGRRIHLVKCHFAGLGLEIPEGFDPWLVAKQCEREYPIIIHRTDRYLGIANYDFLSQLPRDDLFVVGYDYEAKYFIEKFGATWIPTETLDDLASVISSCRLFIGNQSCPVTLAAGLGKPRIMEESLSTPSFTWGTPEERILSNYTKSNLRWVKELLK